MEHTDVDPWSMFEHIGALQLGILLPSCNIKEELSKMQPDDAKKAKRKWRKLRRKARKRFLVYGDDTFTFSDQENKEYEKFLARREVRFAGRNIVHGTDKKCD